MKYFTVLFIAFIAACSSPTEDEPTNLYQVIDTRNDLSAVRETQHTRYHVIKTSGIKLDSLQFLEGNIDTTAHNYLRVSGFKTEIMSTTYLYSVSKKEAIDYLWSYEMVESGF